MKQSLAKYSQDDEIIFEIERILDIVDFSSYFRNDLSFEELNEIKDSKDKLHVKNILKSIK